MAKWDIKDGFWQMDCREGKEGNFSYVLPQPEGQPVRLVVPTSLQMGWVESPSYFCAATETARDTASDYIEIEIGTKPRHKFEHYVTGSAEYAALPAAADAASLRYLLEVYVDDFISLVIPMSQEQLRHVANAILEGIYNVFPPDDDDNNDPISREKLLKDEGRYSLLKTLLGFEFDGNAKTMWLKDAKREKLLALLQSWIRNASRGAGGIPFKQFDTIVAKLRHAFTAIPAGVGLLSPCNQILAQKPNIVWLSWHKICLQTSGAAAHSFESQQRTQLDVGSSCQDGRTMCSQRLQLRGGRRCHRGTRGMHTNGVPVGVATGHQIKHPLGHKSYRESHKLRLRNGGRPPALAGNGEGLPPPTGETGCTVQ